MEETPAMNSSVLAQMRYLFLKYYAPLIDDKVEEREVNVDDLIQIGIPT